MIIDVHSHIISPEIVRRSPMPASLGDIEGAIEAKQDAGIDLTIVGSPSGASTMVPADCVDGYQRPFDQLRSYHDWLGGTVQSYPRNLRAYAYCDVYADEKSLESTAEILRDPAFVGIIANFSGCRRVSRLVSL
ncbi:amidohydrolase family protein [Fodinicola feengrottensis]|uniref:hypothetical protein n=1 Tax=Fodinicola feengrottensis TaxID=435914 RepID=UPI0013D14D02|nr:hypothetical protein [Fodinicola feengrottensis]